MKDYLYFNIKKNDIFTISICLIQKCNYEIWNKLVISNLDSIENNYNIDSDDDLEEKRFKNKDIEDILFLFNYENYMKNYYKSI